MRRFCVIVLLSLSVILFAGTAALWISGYNGSPSAVWKQTKPLTRPWISLSASPGAFHVSRIIPSDKSLQGSGSYFLGFGYEETEAYVFAPGTTPNVRIGVDQSIWISMRWAMLMSAAMPGWFSFKALREKLKVKPGHCRKCGYDLRATPERCPECGEIAVPIQEARLTDDRSC